MALEFDEEGFIKPKEHTTSTDDSKVEKPDIPSFFHSIEHNHVRYVCFNARVAALKTIARSDEDFSRWAVLELNAEMCSTGVISFRIETQIPQLIAVSPLVCYEFVVTQWTPSTSIKTQGYDLSRLSDSEMDQSLYLSASFKKTLRGIHFVVPTGSFTRSLFSFDNIAFLVQNYVPVKEGQSIEDATSSLKGANIPWKGLTVAKRIEKLLLHFASAGAKTLVRLRTFAFHGLAALWNYEAATISAHNKFGCHVAALNDTKLREFVAMLQMSPLKAFCVFFPDEVSAYGRRILDLYRFPLLRHPCGPLAVISKYYSDKVFTVPSALSRESLNDAIHLCEDLWSSVLQRHPLVCASIVHSFEMKKCADRAALSLLVAEGVLVRLQHEHEKTILKVVFPRTLHLTLELASRIIFLVDRFESDQSASSSSKLSVLAGDTKATVFYPGIRSTEVYKARSTTSELTNQNLISLESSLTLVDPQKYAPRWVFWHLEDFALSGLLALLDAKRSYHPRITIHTAMAIDSYKSDRPHLMAFAVSCALAVRRRQLEQAKRTTPLSALSSSSSSSSPSAASS